MEYAVVVDISVSHHLQHGALGEIDLAAIPHLLIGRMVHLVRPLCIGTQRVKAELLPGERVMDYDGITGEDRIGHDRQIRKEPDERGSPGSILQTAGVWAQRRPELPVGRERVEHRADGKDETAAAFRFVAQSPLHPDRRADDLWPGVVRLFAVGNKLFHSA